MAVHPVDVAALIVGLIASASLSYLVYSDSDISLKCNFPDQFTPSAIEYGAAECHGQDASWHLLDNESPINITVKTRLRHTYNQPEGITTLFLADGAIATFSFMLATSIFSHNSVGKPASWMIAYVLTEGIAVLGWLALGVKSHLTLYGQESLSSTSILCDYKARRLGNFHRYTIQCHVSKSTTLDFALQANIAVCFALATGFASHVLLTLVATFLNGMTKPASSAKYDDMEH